MTKTVTKSTTITTTTKQYEVDSSEVSPEVIESLRMNEKNSKLLDTSLDGHLLSVSPSATLKRLNQDAVQSGGTSGGPKLVDFEIIYDQTSTIFTGGDTMTGKLRIALRDAMKMRLIKLQFKGRAGVQWSENKLTKDGSASKQISRNEHVFFDKEIVLLERRPGQEVPAEFVLPAGIHVLPFMFMLPKSLPTSFEGDHGSIRYFCRAVIVKPWKHDHMTKRAFTVLSPQSAVRDQSLMKPIAVSERTSFTSCCCFTGHVTCEISLPKQVYAPGEMITADAKISNLSRRQVTKATISLVQLITYRIGGAKDEKSATSARVVAERVIEKPLQDGKGHWNQEPLFRVPSTAPSFIDPGVNILRIEYELRLELTMGGGRPTDSLLGRLPVTIVLASTPSITTSLTGPPPPIPATNGTTPGNKSTKYVDAVFGRTNMREDDENQYVRGQLEFSPVYPVVES